MVEKNGAGAIGPARGLARAALMASGLLAAGHSAYANGARGPQAAEEPPSS